MKIFSSNLIYKISSILIFIFSSSNSHGDNFVTNSFNNHGVVGLINMPSARFYNESVHGITLYDGYPPQKVTLTSNPYDWLEASFFYTNVQDKPYPGFEYQDYKDKGFNIKVRLKEEGILPAVAIGIYDIAGTGFFNSEYIVASYGINNFDIHFGLAWGTLNGSEQKIKNPLSYIHDSFNNRESSVNEGGQFQLSRYFSSQEVSPFFGFSYVLNSKTLIKLEKDTTDTTFRPGGVDYEAADSNYSFGLEYSLNENFSLGLSFERGNTSSLKFIYKNNPKRTVKKYSYEEADHNKDDTSYKKLVNNLEKNGIGVNKILEKSNSIGIELTQFTHPNLQIIEEIIRSASTNAGINKDIKKNIKIAELNAFSEYDDDYEKSSKLIYERKKTSGFDTNTSFKFRPFLASREEFFKGAFLIENDSEYVFSDNFFFNSNLKYVLKDNFDDLRFPPIDVYPAQVRSDVKQYLKNMDEGILIGRAQFDYHITPIKNHNIMFTAGILEDMFSGYGMEYLYFKQNTNYSFGVELFKVKKRDYDWGFGHLDYENVMASANFYYRNYGSIPFDLKLTAGEYLAGDIGSTIELSRSFSNGVNFGVFATFTDVSAEQFGEGSFDKGIFFNIPIYGNFINYTWRPLTKDPGASLVRRNSLHDLLVRFRPIN